MTFIFALMILLSSISVTLKRYKLVAGFSLIAASIVIFNPSVVNDIIEISPSLGGPISMKGE
ncbi:hypothetical protein [Priestia megaterium]|uniref:hypothetical protein n=1 Tax=Priestia megaterium TaxID=1404 RepID=UPI0034D57F69